MKIRVGKDETLYGYLSIRDGKLDPIPAKGQSGEELLYYAEFYARYMVTALGVPEAEVTPEGVLKTMLERMQGRTWAYLESE